MHEFLFLAILSWALVLIAVILMSGSYRRFLDGSLKSMLRWILIGLWFMAVPYTAFILRDAHYFEGMDDEISYFIYFTMIITAIFLIIGAYKLHLFSKVYGFADTKKRMHKATSKKKMHKKKKK